MPMATSGSRRLPASDERSATHSAVLPRAADGCIARMMCKPNAARTPRCCFRRASGCWFATHSAVLPWAGGRLHGPDDAQVEPREVAVGRRAIASVELLTTGSPRKRSRQSRWTGCCVCPRRAASSCSAGAAEIAACGWMGEAAASSFLKGAAGGRGRLRQALAAVRTCVVSATARASASRRGRISAPDPGSGAIAGAGRTQLPTADLRPTRASTGRGGDHLYVAVGVP